MTAAIGKFTGDEFITYDADATYPYGFLRVRTVVAVFIFRFLLLLSVLPLLVGSYTLLEFKTCVFPGGYATLSVFVVTKTKTMGARRPFEKQRRSQNGRGFRAAIAILVFDRVSFKTLICYYVAGFICLFVCLSPTAGRSTHERRGDSPADALHGQDR